jgi:hypothetical protein
MRQKSQTRQIAADKAINDIRRATRKQYSAEEKPGVDRSDVEKHIPDSFATLNPSA